MIELRNVFKKYQSGHSEIQALRGVNFKVNAGDFLIVRGPSGSGKSTLLNILGLLDEPTEGEVLLKGNLVSYKDYDALASLRSRNISFIFQSFNLNPVLTLEENIMVPLMIRSDIPKSEKIARVAEWVNLVGLHKHRHHRPDELSGGQRQRVAIARAMVSLPELVIADEPTANLDSQTSRRVLELMKELNLQKRTAFVFATHDSILDEYSDSIHILKDGLFVPRGS